MAKKLGYDVISTEINKFITTTVDHYQSHAYAAGALQSQLAYALTQLPAYKQQEALEILAQLTAKYSTK